MMSDPKQEAELMADLWSPAIADDLLKYVRYVYPWGVKGTPLEHYTGPRKWQCEDLDEISQHIADNKGRIALDFLPQMFQKSTVSGRGVGKSAEVSWLIQWMQTTRIGSTVIVTANTEAQLKTKTWAELGKWNTLAINAHWFDYGAMSLRPAKWYEEALKRDLKIDTGYYYAQALTWSEENPDAFAGAHNPLGILLLMDEASGIASKIWSVSEGFFTEPVPDRYWCVYSNGRRNSGAFYETQHPRTEGADVWEKRKLDSRTVEGTDPAIYKKIIDKYGADSDEARVEVYGQFPLEGDMQFISNGTVDAAQRRELRTDTGAPLIMGVDIARLGRDSTVLRFRQGYDARSIPPIKLHGKTTDVVEDAIAEAILKYDPDGVCIDAGNNGSGVIDHLRKRGYRIEEVWFGSSATAGTDKKKYDDKASELYGDMKDWLEAGGCLDGDPKLFTDLTAREKRTVGKQDDRIKLETKDDFKGRGYDSPDDGDALACTFFKNFARRDRRASRRGRNAGRQARDVDYNLFGR